MTANVALTDTFGTFKDKANELIVMTTAGMTNYAKINDTTQSTSNTTGSIITAGGVGIAKNVTIGGSVNVHGNLHANGSISSDGDLTLGDAATDSVTFGADVNSHIIPNTDNTFDLGSVAQEWRNLYIDGTANIDAIAGVDTIEVTGTTQSTSVSSGSIFTAGGVGIAKDVHIGGTTESTSNTTGSIVTAGGVGIAKNVTIGGSVNVHGNLHANGNITSDGSLTFGDADTDNIVLNADVNSNIIPNTDNTYDLGSATQEWKDLYVDGIAYVDTINLNGTEITRTASDINQLGTIGDVMALSIALG